MKSKINTIVVIIALTLFVLGLVGFFRMFIYAGTEKQAISKNELPLGGLNGVVVDSTGNIYCSITSYSRIQVYNPKGEFLYGIGINTAAGDFNIDIDENDNLYVATVRNDKVYTFNNGNLISEEISNERYFENDKKYLQKQFTDKNGNKYSLNDSIIFPSVVKTEPAGNKTVVVKTSLLSWMLMGPLPAFLFVLLGMGILFYQVLRKLGEPFRDTPKNK